MSRENIEERLALLADLNEEIMAENQDAAEQAALIVAELRQAGVEL